MTYHRRVKRLPLLGLVCACASSAKLEPPVAQHAAPPPPVAAAPAEPTGPATRIDARRPAPPPATKPDPLLELLGGELQRSMTELGRHGDAPYHASYEAGDARSVNVTASFGAISRSSDLHHRWVDIDVRAGDHKLDSSHRVRGARPDRGQTRSATLPLADDDYAIRSTLWLETDAAYKTAVEQLKRVQASAKVTVKQDDDSDDFSHETPATHVEPPAAMTLDRAAWEARLRPLSQLFRGHPDILDSSLALTAIAETDYFVNSEGTRYQVPFTHARIRIQASAQTDDGMELHRFEAFDVATPDRLPGDAEIRARIELVIADLDRLRRAPVVEPYTGPAILEGQAAGVFFHEVFGHRIEGHRQKDDSEGQTFAKKIGQAITAPFIDVYDDPTIASLNGVDLNGYYPFDDEGVAGQKVSLVERGVLRTFLLGRSPARGFVHSNGHGRRQEGRSVVARQGNLIVTAAHTVDRATLRRMLLDEIHRQGKPYGMLFKQLDGGFTMTTTFSPQAFKLLPVMVYRIYPDGREELVRGADLEGTPLTALGDIRAAADDLATFNGYCGAESGFVPVSASAPSLLVAHVEVTRKAKGQARPPVLPPAPAGGDQ
jgi:predicted Zn-dependent protease